MKILYLSQRFSFKTSGIYADLINALVKDKNDVTIVSCISDNNGRNNAVFEENGCKMINVNVGNQFGVRSIKKAFVQFTIPFKMLKSIKKNLWDEEYDLILYPTPPITFSRVVKQCKKRYNAKSYLMLKDIFPQNAVDLGMIKRNGIIHNIYRIIENDLYKQSDRIGCMTNANLEYVKSHYKEKIADKLELFPNTVDCELIGGNTVHKRAGQTVFLFGGNMGKPQAVDFLLECIDELKSYDKAKFLLIGNGSEVKRINDYIEKSGNTNVDFKLKVPREEYEKIVSETDVGIVMLNYKFTIPNFPARTLSYMAKKLPILACTDEVTDIKELVIEEAKCGLWCKSNDKEAFCSAVRAICEKSDDELNEMGQNGFDYLKDNFDVDISVKKLKEYMQDNSII